MSKDERVFAALSEGRQVRMPLGKTFFSPRFGHARGSLRRLVDGSRGGVKPERRKNTLRARTSSEKRGPCYVPSRTRDSSLKPRPNPRQMSVLRLL